MRKNSEITVHKNGRRTSPATVNLMFFSFVFYCCCAIPDQVLVK